MHVRMLVVSHHAHTHSAAQVQAHSYGDGLYEFTAKLAFQTSGNRNLAFQYFLEWRADLESMHLYAGSARNTLKYAYTALRQVIIVLLQTADLTKVKAAADSIEPIFLLMALWADNCDAITKAMICLVDLLGVLFDGRSSWEDVLKFVGREEDLKGTTIELFGDCEHLHDLAFQLDGCKRPVYVRLEYLMADHHALGIINSVPGGTSRHRSPFGHTDARYFGTVAYQCALKPTVGFLDEQFEGAQHLMQAALKVAQDQKQMGVKQRAGKAKEGDELALVFKIFKKMNARPLLANGPSKTLLHVLLVPPAMHVISAQIRTILELFLQFVIPPEHTSRLEWEQTMTRAASFTSTGQFAASAGIYRELIQTFSMHCGAGLVSLTKFWYLPKLMCFCAILIYHKHGNTVGRRLALRIVEFYLWMGTSALSAWFGGKDGKDGKLKLHTDNLYWNSAVSAQVEVCELGGFSPALLLEEDCERSFQFHQVLCSALVYTCA